MISASHIEGLVGETDQITIGSGYRRIKTAKPYLNYKTHAYLDLYIPI